MLGVLSEPYQAETSKELIYEPVCAGIRKLSNINKYNHINIVILING